MSIIAIIPVKSLAVSKSRLALYYSASERRELSLAMLKDVVGAVEHSKYIDKVYIITPDASIQHHLYSSRRIKFLFDNGVGQTPAVIKAINHITKNGVLEVLVLLVADIPLIQTRNIDEIISIAINKEHCVLAPSIDGGTNIMTQFPEKIIKLMYGKNSFMKHLKQARSMGLKVSIYDTVETSLDIDTIEDVEMFLKIGRHGYTYELLKSIKRDKEK